MYRKVSQSPSPEPEHTRRRSLDLFRRSRRVSEPALDLGMRIEPPLRTRGDLPHSPGSDPSEPLLGSGRRVADPLQGPGSDVSEPLLGSSFTSGSITGSPEEVMDSTSETEDILDSRTRSLKTEANIRTNESVPKILEPGASDPLSASRTNVGVETRFVVQRTCSAEVGSKVKKITGQGARRLSLQPFKIKSGSFESGKPSRKSPSRESELQTRKVSISPSRDTDPRTKRVCNRVGGRRLSLDLFGFISDQSESGDPQVKVESRPRSRRPSMDMFRPKQDPNEPQLYPGRQVKSQEEVRTNIYQLFYGDRAGANNKRKSRVREEILDGRSSGCSPDVPDGDPQTNDSGDSSLSEHKGSPSDTFTTATAGCDTSRSHLNVASKNCSQQGWVRIKNAYSATAPDRQIGRGLQSGAWNHGERCTQSGTLYPQEPLRRGSARFGSRL